MKMLVLFASLLLAASTALAQDDFGSPIGEDAAPIGGAMVGGDSVGNAPIQGPMIGGGAIGDAPLEGPMIGGGAVGNAPLGGAPVEGAAVGQEEDDAAVGDQPLY